MAEDLGNNTAVSSLRFVVAVWWWWWGCLFAFAYISQGVSRMSNPEIPMGADNRSQKPAVKPKDQKRQPIKAKNC